MIGLESINASLLNLLFNISALLKLLWLRGSVHIRCCITLNYLIPASALVWAPLCYYSLAWPDLFFSAGVIACSIWAPLLKALILQAITPCKNIGLATQD